MMVFNNTKVIQARLHFRKEATGGPKSTGALIEIFLLEPADPLLMGRFINHIDVKEHRKVCVIGEQIYETLFPDGSDPCGKFINANGIYYQVIGVNTSAGNMSINGWPPTTITIPFSTMQQNFNLGDKIELLCYTARPGHSVKDIQARIEPILKQAL